jgi:hypothetical protein
MAGCFCARRPLMNWPQFGKPVMTDSDKRDRAISFVNSWQRRSRATLRT